MKQPDSISVISVSEQDSDLILQVEALAESLRLDATKEPELGLESTGFLISRYDAAKFRDFIHGGGILLAAQYRENPILGYLLATPGTSFRGRHPSTKISWLPKIPIDSVASDFEMGNFTYLDQMGIEPGHRGKGVAQALLAALYRRRPIGELFLAAILTGPIHNKRSESFFIKMGYVPMGEALTPEFHRLKNVKSVLIGARNGGFLP